MKIIIQKKITKPEEIEIPLPYFVKYGSKLIKITSEDSAIAVNLCLTGVRMENASIETYKGYDSSIKLFLEGGEPITKEDFLEELGKVLEVILPAIKPQDRNAEAKKEYPVYIQQYY